MTRLTRLVGLAGNRDRPSRWLACSKMETSTRSKHSWKQDQEAKASLAMGLCCRSRSARSAPRVPMTLTANWPFFEVAHGSEE